MENMVPSEELATAQERMIPASQVTKTVAERYNAGVEKGREEALAEMAKQNQLSEERARQIAQEESVKHSENIAKTQLEQMQRQAAQEMVGQFNNKIAASKERHPDIEQKIATLDLPTMPELVRYAMSVNVDVGDFMVELASHPQKALAIVTAERLGNRNLAQKLSNDLAKSIDANLKAVAQAENSAKEPLRHVKPSNVGGDDGQMSIAELRKQKHLKG